MIQTFWSKIKDSFFVALTAVLILIIAVVVVWFVIKIVPTIFSVFRNGVATTLDSVYISNDDASALVNKKTITSGDTFVISLGEVNNGELYTFTYPCTDGVSFSLQDSQKTKIDCGKDFYLLNNSSEVSVSGISTQKRIAMIPVKIGVQTQDSQKIKPVASFSLTITNTGYSAPNTATSTTYKPPVNTYVPPTNIYIGKADLAVSIIDTGVIDKNTLQFSKTSYISSTDRVGIKFEVKNIGDRATGVWNFSAILPSQSSPTYQSDMQISLNPGDKIQFTLGFDNPTNVYGVNTVTINVDPSNYVSEISKSNNSASINVSTNYNYNNNYNYNQNNSGNLVASCYSIPTNPAIGESVTWHATVSGGTGYNTYYWTGTDNLVGSSQNVSRIYYTTGQKNANVIITSGGYTVSRGCTVNVGGYNNNNNYGNSDLSVRLLGVGMLDSSNNFVYATQIPRYSNVAVKLEVTNNGTNNSGLWDLTATMSPSMSSYTYRSTNYPSIAPGQRTEVVINFSGANYLGDNYIFVKIDPNNLTTDTNRSNNTLTSTIRVY